MRHSSRPWPMRQCGPGLATSGLRFQHANARRRRRLPLCKKQRSRSGGLSSRRRVSRANERRLRRRNARRSAGWSVMQFLVCNRGVWMSGEATAVLAEFAASLTYEAIPERVRDYSKDLLLDALACAVAGHLGEETPQLAALSSALAQSRESTVIGGDRLSLAGSTMLNGYLITAV